MASADSADADGDRNQGRDRECYRGLTASDKLVLAAIETGEDTRAGIGELTLLPERTVNISLRRLRDADLVRRRADPTDARRTICVLYGDVDAPFLGER
jgi:DNA-binding MarR family transcriptional regulator